MAVPKILSATTLEQQIVELNRKAADERNAYALANPLAPLEGFTITQTFNLAAKTMSFAITVPVTVVGDIDGGFSVDAKEVMVPVTAQVIS